MCSSCQLGSVTDTPLNHVRNANESRSGSQITMAVDAPPSTYVAGLCQELLGKQFHELTVLKYVGVRSGAHVFECQCSCGNKPVVQAKNLKAVRTKSCGCLRLKMLLVNLSGMQFGQLTVLSYAGKRGSRSAWLCKCDCGNEKEVMEHNLKSARTLSCGCLQARSLASSRGRNKVDLTEKQFGLLKVIGPSEGHNGYWNCKCGCGAELEIRGSYLTSGRKTHCGCEKKSKTALVGKRFGKLKVRALAGKNHSDFLWDCLCDCGKRCEVRGSLLRSGRKTSCGCESGDSSAPFGKLKQVQRSKVPAWAERLAA